VTRTCTVCTHKDVEEINKRLVAGEPYRSIARLFEASESAVYRHKESHIPESLLKSDNIDDTLNANSLTHQIESIREKIKALLGKAEKADNLRDVHNFVGDTLKQIELEAKLLHQIQEHQVNLNLGVQQFNINTDPEWAVLRTAIIQALEPFAEARAAILAAIHTPSSLGSEDLRPSPSTENWRRVY